MDACSPHAVVPFNAALSNGKCAFPDKIIDKHPDFVAIAAGNTYGTGANRQYVGRYQQDAASLDRFVFIEIDYDLTLERKLVLEECIRHGGSESEKDRAKKFMLKVRSLRNTIKELQINHIISPRATMMGAKLIGSYRNDITNETLMDTLVWKGISDDYKNLIKENNNASF